MGKLEKKSVEQQELSLDESFAQIIKMKKSENSALKKIFNALKNDKPNHNNK